MQIYFTKIAYYFKSTDLFLKNVKINSIVKNYQPIGEMFKYKALK